MNEYWIVYRDVMGYERKKLEKIPAPQGGDVLVRDMVLSGAFGFPPTYIRRHRLQVGVAVVNLITYTETEVSAGDLGLLTVLIGKELAT